MIKTIVSDHSPCTPDLKLLPSHVPGNPEGKGKTATCGAQNGETKGDFFSAWGGISSVGLGLSILWTEARRRELDPETTLVDIVRWCCVNTALQVGLESSKGALKVGMDGDVAVFDPEAEFEVEPSKMLFRNKCSPYQGKMLKGVAKATWLRGRLVHEREGGFGDEAVPEGRLLLEPRTKVDAKTKA